MKKLLYTTSVAIAAVALTFAFSPAQAGPMSFDKNVANNISTTSVSVTKVKKRGHKYHKRRSNRNRSYYRYRDYYPRDYSGTYFSFGIGSYYPPYFGLGYYDYPYYDRYDYGYPYVYEPDYSYPPAYSYEYRGDSKAADRIFKQQSEDGP